MDLSDLQKKILQAAADDVDAVFAVAYLPDGRERIHAGAFLLTVGPGQDPVSTLEDLGLVRRVHSGRYQLTTEGRRQALLAE